MKTSTIPVICGVALAAMSAAGLSHWWSVRQFVAVVDAGIPVSIPPRPAVPLPLPVETPRKPAEKPNAPAMAAAPKAAPASVSLDSHQKAFFEALTTKLESLQNQNSDLLDQMAETNRELLQLQFRVDTHSEQFRPLPVSEDRIDTSFDDSPGVLPPRAEPVLPSSTE